MGISLTTPPIAEPVALEDLKAHCRVDSTDDDGLLVALGMAARGYCENYLNRQLVSAQYTVTLDAFPLYSGFNALLFPYYQTAAVNSANPFSNITALAVPPFGSLSPANYAPMTLPSWGNLAFPKPPLKSVDSVQYLDSHNVLQTWDTANYSVVTSSEPGYLRPLLGYPTVLSNTPEVVKIKFTTGYGNPEDVPEEIKVAIKLIVAYWYAQREAQQVGRQVLSAVHALLDLYRFQGFN